MYDINPDVCKEMIRDAKSLAPEMGVTPAVLVYVFVQMRASHVMTANEIKEYYENMRKMRSPAPRDDAEKGR